MATIQPGLFGYDPTELRQAEQQRWATLYGQSGSPYEKMGLALGQLGGAAVKGLFNIEDPALVANKEATALASQFDLNTAAGLKDYTTALQARAQETGNPQLAAIVPRAAAEYQKAAKSEAEIYSKTKEALPNLAKLQNYRDQLVAQFGPNDPRVAEVNAEISGNAKGKGTEVKVDLGGLANLFAKKEAEAGAKDITDQISAAQSALKTNSKVSRDIAEVEKILPDAFTGQFANFNKTASKTLSAIGVPVSEKASNTETLNALTNSLVIPAIKQLPGSLAAKELAFLQEQKPNTLQEPATIKRLIGMVKDDISVNRALVKRADAYTKQDKLGSLKGFNIALQQDEIYNNVRKLNDLKAKVKAGKGITQEEANFAKSLEQELGN